MPDDGSSYIPNPDKSLEPIEPALEDLEGEPVLDGRRIPKYPGPCYSCAFFHQYAAATEARQTYVDKAGRRRTRLFVEFERRCLVHPGEPLDIKEAALVFCNKHQYDPAVESFFKSLPGWSKVWTKNASILTGAEDEQETENADG